MPITAWPLNTKHYIMIMTMLYVPDKNGEILWKIFQKFVKNSDVHFQMSLGMLSKVQLHIQGLYL